MHQSVHERNSKVDELAKKLTGLFLAIKQPLDNLLRLNPDLTYQAR